MAFVTFLALAVANAAVAGSCITTAAADPISGAAMGAFSAMALVFSLLAKDA